MQRRKFLRSAGVGGAAVAVASTVAAPAIAQSMPEVKWRLASSFPKSLDTIFGAGEDFARRVAGLTDNKFQIRVFAAGEIVPGLQVVDAVQNETVECGHTASYYYVGKDPAFAFDTAIPFGLNTRQHNAWVYYGGGLETMREFYKDYNMTSFLMSHTGGQMGGWWRREIKTPEDMKGVKMRIGGFAGQVLQKLGVVPQQLAGGDIYPALEKGTIDAAEWVGPYDDQKLGFNKVAQYYYYPGWWEGSAALSLYVGLKAYEALPNIYKEAIAAAAGETTARSVAKYDAQNPKALRELAAGGTKFLPFPQAVLEACFNSANELYAETVAKNPKFKKIYESWKPFRNEEVLWFRVVENTFDNFMARQSAAGKL
jgi:TRAP-type mannitol/chloroaromatic compound transport system substrate-binding protein